MIALDDVTCLSATPEELCRTLRIFGVARIPNFLTSLEIREILDEAKLATAKFANYRNPYGPCSRFSLRQLPTKLARSRDLVLGDSLSPLPAEFPRSRQVTGSEFFQVTTRSYLGRGCGFMEVVSFTKDCTPDESAMYGKLHFDRRHQLKFILYLNDVDQSNGAFGCIPSSHRAGRRLFHSRWRESLGLREADDAEVEAAAAGVAEDDAEYSSVRCVIESRTAGSATARRRLSVDGKAGTLVAFDTHLLHYGGFVTRPNDARWTLKGHTFAHVPR